MRRLLRSAAATALPLALLALAAGPLAGQRYALDGDRVSVYNLAGSVRVEPGGGGNVTVEVDRGGPDADRLSVERGTVDGRRALWVVYPGDRVVYPEMGRGSTVRLRMDGDGLWGRRVRRGREVTVAGRGSGIEAHADLVVRVPAGRDVAVYLAAGRVEVSNVRGRLLVDTHSASVAVSGTEGALTVDTGSGSVAVRDAEGDLVVDTGSGAVTLSSVRGGRVLIDTGSGGVRGSGIAARSLEVDVGSGRVNLTGVAADDAVVDTGSGSVVLGLTRDARSVVIDTGSGSVDLIVPDDFGATLEIDTGSGGIDVDVPVEVRRSSRGDFVGRIGDGDGRVLIDTGSGRVRIRRP